MPVPAEMKNAVRFICDLGLKMMTFLGYDKFALPNAAVGILTYFPGTGHKRPAQYTMASRAV